MMLALIRMNLLLHRPTLLMAGPALLLYMGWFASQESLQGAFIPFACAIAVVLPIVLIALDDVYSVHAFVCSLPRKRRQVVRAKYVFSWGLAVPITACGLVCLAVFSEQPVWTIPTLSRVFLILTLILGVALPFALRFGWLGLTVFGIGAQLLALGTYAILKAFVSRIQFPNIYSTIANWLGSVHESLGGPAFYVAAFTILLFINLASCKFSEVMFAGREL